ncbi:hypothetical protein SLS64_008171 [Diaporthe eres]
MAAPRTLYYWLAKASLLGFSLAATDKATYTDHSVTAIKTLQTFYDEPDGLWQTTGWWNSANCLTVLGDFLSLAIDGANDLDLDNVLSNTFTRAQQTSQTATKTLVKGSSRRFLFDYLRRALAGFVSRENESNGREHPVANELYLSVAASLANRAAGSDSYLSIARDEWDWFKGSGMINENNLINDGLDINPDGSCSNNGDTVWSYNQGVILGGLVELSKATGDSEYLSEATSIAEAAIEALSENGILHESCEPNDCGADGSQFKGIFMRNLYYLQLEAPQDSFRSFILDNADSIWNNDRNSSDFLGLVWSGPPSAGGFPNASTQSSALDTLVAAGAVF